MKKCGEPFLSDRAETCQLEAGHAGEHHSKTKLGEIWWKSATDLEREKEKPR